MDDAAVATKLRDCPAGAKFQLEYSLESYRETGSREDSPSVYRVIDLDRIMPESIKRKCFGLKVVVINAADGIVYLMDPDASVVQLQ